jgi:phosphate transport system protein
MVGPFREVAVEEMRRTYHENLDGLRVDVVRLGFLVSGAIAAATEALLDADEAIDEMTRTVEEACYTTLALQQPMASDLRMVVAVLRCIHELERTGDLMVNIAKATRRLYPVELPSRIRALLAQMGNQARLQLRLAVEAFAEFDAPRALALEDMDDVMDDLQRELFRTIFTLGDEAGLQQSIQVALVGRYYERAADHAVNVGQRVAYIVTGEIPGAETDVGPAGGSPGEITIG